MRKSPQDATCSLRADERLAPPKVEATSGRQLLLRGGAQLGEALLLAHSSHSFCSITAKATRRAARWLCRIFAIL
jgi:hypothetical protein